MWRKEINLFCVSSVVVFISDLAFCKKIYQKYCIFVNLFSPQKKLRYFFKFSHENEIYKKIVKSPPAHCSETVKSRLPCIWFFYENTKFSSCPGANMRCQGPLGNARAKPHHWMYNLLIFNNLSYGDFRMPVKIPDNITQYIIQNWNSLFLLLLVPSPFLFFVTRQEVRQCHLHHHWNRINNFK